MSTVINMLLWVLLEAVLWVVYVLFMIGLWLLLFPILVVACAPIFAIRAAVHPSSFGSYWKQQYGKLLTTWLDLSIRLVPI